MSYGTKSIDNSQDIIDSRDVIKRIEELEGDRQALQDAVDEAQEALGVAKSQCYDGVAEEDNKRAIEDAQEDLRRAKCELEDWTGDEEAEIDPSDDAEELKNLKELADDMENECEWESGIALIRESYFTEYAEELAGDIGAISPDAQWPLSHIDWEAAASELKNDYSTVEFGEETYYFRS
jgi:hypothetical protein